jgi:hypothetical protein
MSISIKSALGWLALLLFATTAQAEGARDLLRGGPGKTARAAPVAASVVQKTKAPPPPRVPPPSVLVPAHAVAVAERAPLTIVESAGKPKADYEVDGAIAMVFEHQRRATFRVGRDRIKRVVRFAMPARARDHIDVLDTEDGVIVVETTVHTSGASTSDVYAFAPRALLEQRVGALESVVTPTRDRIREALVAAEWSR